MRRGLVVLLLCLAWGCADSSAAQVPGATASCAAVETIPIQGGAHLIGDVQPPVPYNSTPPTSGWHSSGAFAIGARSQAMTEPEQVSALEAGAAVITYNGLPPDEVDLLEETATRDFPGRVVTTPYDRLGAGEVAFTAWGTLQRCDALDLDALAAFVSTYADPEPVTPASTDMAAAFDPTDPVFVADPYPTYEHLRREAPLEWYEPGAMWLVSRHGDVDALLRDRRLGRVFQPREPDERFGPWNLLNVHSMLELEPPQHTRLRRLVAGEFTPRRVEALRPRVRALVDELLDPIAEAGEADIIAELAEPLPVAVIAELLGIPASDQHLLRPWSNAIVALYELAADEDAAERAIAASEEFDTYLRELIAWRRREPGPDLLSALVRAEGLTTDELVATAVLLLNAGHEASVNVLGNGAVALLRQPDQLDRVRADPGLVPLAVEELIRYDSPLSLFTRAVFAPVEVAGRTLTPGERVGLLLGSANRDGDVFDAPDTLDVGRRRNPHVGFGAGIHFCLGAPLARVELQEALDRLITRFADLALVREPPVRPTFQFRGYRTVRVALR